MWGKTDPLFAVASWENRNREGTSPWTEDEFFQLGKSDWQDFVLAVAKTIENDQFVAARQQFDTDMGTDVTGAASDEQMPGGHALLSVT